jgi:hypothetical protein
MVKTTLDGVKIVKGLRIHYPVNFGWNTWVIKDLDDQYAERSYANIENVRDLQARNLFDDIKVRIEKLESSAKLLFKMIRKEYNGNKVDES